MIILKDTSRPFNLQECVDILNEMRIPIRYEPRVLLKDRYVYEEEMSVFEAVHKLGIWRKSNSALVTK